MTDLATPGEIGAEIDNGSVAHALTKAGIGAWIVPDVDIAGYYSSLDETALNGFEHASSTGLDVTIDPGEAYVMGWLCRDRQTTVSLPADSTTTIYVGYDVSATLGDGESPADSENVLLGTEGVFSSKDPRAPIWEFTTNADSVTGSTDRRQTEQVIGFDPDTGNLNIGAMVEDLLADSIEIAPEGGTGRIYYDTELEGRDVHFQRDSTTDETALSFEGTNVGINETNPEHPLHVGGATVIDAGLTVTGQVSLNEQAQMSGGWSAFGSMWANGNAIHGVNESGDQAVSSPDTGRIFVQSSEPNGSDGDIWIDTSD